MSEIPDALRYGASHSTIRTNRFRLVPTGSDTANPNGTVRVRLPEKSLVRLSSLSAYFTATVSGLAADAANWQNALMPASYKFFRSVKFYVGGAIASGGLCNNYDQLYHALVISSADKAWVESRFNEGYKELISPTDDTVLPAVPLVANPTVTSKSQYLTCSDFLGLPRCNGGGGVIDTSLYSAVEIEFNLNDANFLSAAWAGTATGAGLNWQLTNFRVDVDCVTSVSPLYVEMMSLRLQEAAPIRFPYQNFVTVIAQNTGSNRVQVNSQSVDMMMVAPLRADYNQLSNLAGATAGGVSNQMQAHRYKFDSYLASTAAGGNEGVNTNNTAALNSYIANEGNLRYQIVVGSDTYPKQIIDHALMIPDLTINTLYHGSLYSKNLFSSGLQTSATGGSQGFFRGFGLADNFIWINNFSLESEGWATKRLTGIDTSAQNVDIILNSTLPAANYLLAALTTSQLVYDPQSATVSIVA
jgi:hypothetical protein